MKPSQPISAEILMGGRALGDPRVVPGETLVSFVTASTERAELAIVPAGGGMETWLPLQPAIARPSSRGGVHDWLPDGSGVVYIGADGHLHRFDFAGFACRPLTKVPGDLSTVSVSPDGKSAVYAIDLAQIAVVSLTPDTTWPYRLSGGADFVVDPVWSPDGKYIAWHEWDVPNMPWHEGRIVVRKADASEPAFTVAGGPGISVQQPRFSPDGNSLAFISDESGWANVWVVDVPSFDNARSLVDEQFEHAEPTWGGGQRSYAWVNGGSQLAHFRNEEGFGKIVFFDVANNDPVSIEPGYSTAIDASGSTVACLTSDADLATELVVTKGNSTRTVARAALAGIERSAVIPERVSWTAGDGATVHGRLYRTAAQQPTSQIDGDLPPLLVWLHGGPTSQSATNMFPLWNYFIDRGWSLLVPDYRGSSGWGRDYMLAMDGRWGELDVSDTAAGINAAVTNGWGDPKRIVPIGGSSAGLTLLLLGAQYPELCSALVAMFPVVDIFGLAELTHRYEAHYTDSLVGPLPDCYPLYVERSAITHVDKIDAPLLILHGDADNVVPIEASRKFVAALERAGKTVEFQVYQGEGHGFRMTATKVDQLKRIESFLRHHVLHVATSPFGSGEKAK